MLKRAVLPQQPLAKHNMPQPLPKNPIIEEPMLEKNNTFFDFMNYSFLATIILH
jgi:hypothetical protein